MSGTGLFHRRERQSAAGSGNGLARADVVGRGERRTVPHRTAEPERSSRRRPVTRQDVITEDAKLIAARLDGLAGKTVMVSGASGLLGRYLVMTLAEGGAYVVKANYLGRSVTAPETHVDHIIHAESPYTARDDDSDPVGLISVNTQLLTRLLDIARRHKAHVTFVSSIDDVGRVDPLDLESGYVVGQRAGEALCVAYRAQYGVRSSVVRLPHTYGPGMPLDDPRVHARIIRSTLAGEPIVLKTDGLHERAYLYVADAAEAVLRVAVSGADRETTLGFDVIDERSRVTIRELAHATLHAAGRPPAVAVQLGQTPILVKPELPLLGLDAIYGLGWKPNVQLHDGLARTIRWHREQMDTPA